MENQTIDVIDIGVNLTHDSFDPDRDAVIERARAAGVSRMIITGTTVAASLDAAELAATRPGQLFATAGIHPHHAEELAADSTSQLAEIAARPGVVAIGECGLDYFRNYSPRDAQLQAFESQLQLAEKLQKPVFLHQRDAHDDFLTLLKDYLPRIPGGVAHCFTAGVDELCEYLELGLYIGLTGWICDERRGQSLREAVLELPMERVLLETDAPYLLPRDLPEKTSGRRNEPQYLPHILASVARLMQQEPAELAAAARRNTERLFALPNAR